jgi:hypothetical protein
MPADSVTFPLSGPSISGTTYTVDFLLENPTRVTQAGSRFSGSTWTASSLPPVPSPAAP